jgi:hypothetical protein
MLSAERINLKRTTADFHNLPMSRKVYIAGQSKVQAGNPGSRGLMTYLREAKHESKYACSCGGSGSRVP